jgi:hypothetical protein
MTSLRNIEVELARFRHRIVVASAVVLGCFALLGLRLIYLQVFKHEHYTPSDPADPFRILGPADGMISVLQYAGYALNYEQIDRQMRAGPSTKLVSATQNLPPYLADNWWVTYTSGQ